MVDIWENYYSSIFCYKQINIKSKTVQKLELDPIIFKIDSL